MELNKLKLEKIKLLEAKLKHQKNLPHLYLHKMYKWQREFLDSTNKNIFLVASNQSGKSTIQIIKTISWATNKDLWPLLWPGKTPNLMWYLYPSKDLADLEFETKWKPLLPQNEYKDHPVYGWEARKEKGKIDSIAFNSGILLAFRTYAQEAINLQASSVHYIALDEELPFSLYPELNFRRQGVDGYLSMSFTATLAQDEWRRTIEPTEQEKNSGKEMFPDAHKMQISMFDCQKFEDGTPSHFTSERINTIISSCGTHNEVLRRVYGRFVKSEGLVYESFSTKECVVPGHPVPKAWIIYAGIDSGSGGEKGDPAAILFIAVKPDYSEGRVIKAWKGDGVVTTSTDILSKYIEMRRGLNVHMCSYDWSDKDLYIIASRLGISLVKAHKEIDAGVNTVNALFKNGMLKLYDGEDGLLKLAQELSALGHDTPMRRRVDHLCDALRYCCQSIPWDWSKAKIQDQLVQEIIKAPGATPQEREMAARRGFVLQSGEEQDSIEDEFDEINSLSEI